MAFQSVPETAVAEVIYTQHGETLQMGFYAKFAGGYTQTDITLLADIVDTRVGLSFLPIQTAECTYERTEVRGLEDENDFTATDSTNTGIGANISGSLPNQVTYSVKRASALTGRSARGRVYWIGLARDDLAADDNFLNAVDATAIVAAIENMRNTLNGSGWAAVIVSRVTGGLPRIVGVTFPWISTVGVDARVDTLRNRLPS